MSSVEQYAVKLLEATLDDWSAETVQEAQSILDKNKIDWEMANLSPEPSHEVLSDEAEALRYGSSDQVNNAKNATPSPTKRKVGRPCKNSKSPSPVKPAVGTKKSNVGTKKPTVATKIPTAGSKKPAVGNRRPTIGYRRPNVGYKRPMPMRAILEREQMISISGNSSIKKVGTPEPKVSPVVNGKGKKVSEQTKRTPVSITEPSHTNGIELDQEMTHTPEVQVEPTPTVLKSRRSNVVPVLIDPGVTLSPAFDKNNHEDDMNGNCGYTLTPLPQGRKSLPKATAKGSETLLMAMGTSTTTSMNGEATVYVETFPASNESRRETMARAANSSKYGLRKSIPVTKKYSPTLIPEKRPVRFSTAKFSTSINPTVGSEMPANACTSVSIAGTVPPPASSKKAKAKKRLPF